MAVQERIQLPSEGIGSAAPLPFASEGAFGASVIGSSIAAAGGELQDSQLRALRAEKQRQEESANAAAAPGAAQLSLDLARAAQAGRDAAPLDGAGHVAQFTQQADALVGKYLASIPDDRVRERWSARAAEISANQVGDEDGWARGRRIEAIGTNAKTARNLFGNQLQGNPDPHAFDQALKSGETFWTGVDAPADVKAKGLREWKADTTEDYATGWIEKDPAIALAQLKSGALDDWLDPDKKRVLIDRAETGIRVADADQRRKQSQAETQLRTDARELTTKISQGVLVDDKDVAGIVGRAQALGLKDVAEGLQYDLGTLKMSRLTDKWTLADWSAHVDPLAVKVAQGKASDDEQRQLKILQQLRPGKEERFRSNPDQAASASGIPVPQFDLDNPTPQSAAARASWAESWAHTSHLAEPPYLNKDQLNAYRQRVTQGPVGQLEASAELRDTWGPARAASIVRQIGGDPKADMLVMIGLEPRMADLYRKGVDQLKAPGFKFDDKRAEELFQPYRRGLPVELQNSVFSAAKNITAGYAAEQGKAQAGGGNFDHAFAIAVHRAVGLLGDPTDRGATGGFVQWNGRYAVAPQTMTHEDLQSRISRAQPIDWIHAAVDPRGNPANTVPHHLGPGGKLTPYTKGEALRFRQGQLETVSPGIYRLIGADGNPVVDQHGKPWQFDVRRLPSAFDEALAAHGYSRH